METIYFGDTRSTKDRVEREVKTHEHIIRCILALSIAVLALTEVASLLTSQAVEGAKLHNLQTYHDERGFQPVMHK